LYCRINFYQPNGNHEIKMGEIAEKYHALKNQIPAGVKLVAVSKTKSPEQILEVYDCGHRIFGESKAQELVSKYEQLPKDIEWHMIGHLQSNKVKYIAPFVNLIHSVDSLKLLITINKEAHKNNRVVRLPATNAHSRGGNQVWI
jgi:PLP dependent protein